MRLEEFDLPYRPVKFFVWENATVLDLASKLRPQAYLSHFSALMLNELTDQIPKTVYVNWELRKLPASPGGLTQEGIRNAFRRKQRTNSNVCTHGDFRVMVINGKNTERLGVIELDDAFGRPVPVTQIERTLIDVTVRPLYAGGVGEVLGAFRRAREQLSVNRLIATLKKMEYKYPYAQAIGFYLERAGYPSETTNRLREISPMEFDFYLTYAMAETDYSPEWRMYFPKGL